MQLFYRKKLLKNSYRLNSFTLEAWKCCNMQMPGALGFSAEIEQKGDEKEFFLFIASPIS
jgi:hypothetical protein